jgi:3'(2'), 5'-bisphosphate nucleotidase
MGVVILGNYLALMNDIAREAGAAILEIYSRDDFGVETKSDNSPLTLADLAAHNIIVDRLTAAVPEIPILSEESHGIGFDERGGWQRYFLVDPLDGTKEFINRNGEFTVNIALIDKGVPIQGVVYVPVTNVLYAGDQLGSEAYVERDGTRVAISVRDLGARLAQSLPLIVVASRRHGGDALAACMNVLKQQFDEIDTTNMGSSLKLCLVAEGKADFYPRLAPTSEWDTAAAQAVVEAAGGVVLDTNFDPLRYNTKENILNPYFYVLGDAQFDWERVLQEVDLASITGD